MVRRAWMPVLVCVIVVTANAWTHAQKASGGSLTAQDYAEISQLYSRYNWAIDGGDAAGYADTFTPDGVFNTFTGRDALVKFATDYTGRHRRHWNSNLVITPTADGAAGKVYLLLVDVSAKPPAIANAVQYEDILVKTASGWKFKQRKTRPDTAAPPKPVQ